MNKLKIFFVCILLLMASGLFLFYFFSSRVRIQYANPDTEKIRQIKMLGLALELYHKKNQKYPDTGPTCQDASVLQKYLTKEYLGGSRVFDSTGTADSLPKYSYASSNDGGHYVLKTDLRDRNNLILKNDLDGNVLGCNCDDSALCLSN